MTVAVAGNFMPPIKDLPYQLRVLLCGPAQNEPGSRYIVPSEQVKKSPVVRYDRGWQAVPVVKRETVREDVNYEPLFEVHGKKIESLIHRQDRFTKATRSCPSPGCSLLCSPCFSWRVPSSSLKGSATLGAAGCNRSCSSCNRNSTSGCYSYC